MNIYHGNYYKIENPKIITGKYTKDFGEGFYCTILKEQAIKWAKKFDTPVLNIYEYNEDLNLKIKEFISAFFSAAVAKLVRSFE